MPDPTPPNQPPPEPVWTYRGYQLKASEFTTAMVHMFRAEVQRANVWRQRLDTTTNWAVITTGAVLSFAFTNSTGLHIVIPINMVLVTLFLWIETRRDRYYELWSSRVRLMETDFFAAMLVPPFQPAPDWAEALAESLLHPQFPISTWEAMGRRLRRNYLWIYIIIGTAWIIKLWLMPTTVFTAEQFFRRASIGTIPGQLVLLVVLLFYIFIFATSLATLGMHQAAGEVLPRYGSLSEGLAAVAAQASKLPYSRAWFRPSRHRQQYLVIIITSRGPEVSQRILKDMRRGVTSLPGTGMFTGQSRPVLLCAIAVTEIPHLKALVHAEDPAAFVIVSPAQEVFGRGFAPLEE